MTVFNLTADLVTEDSCFHGDWEKAGFLDESGQLTNKKDNYTFSLTELRDLLGLYWERSSDTWITATKEMCNEFNTPSGLWSFLDDDSVDSDILSGQISIHRPDDITDASWERVLKLFKVA